MVERAGACVRGCHTLIPMDKTNARWAAVVAGAIGVFGVPEMAVAWDAHGHRVVTYLALDEAAKGGTMPAWLNDAATRQRIAYQSAEPDRWRGQPTSALKHENAPDHYLDIEDLEPYGLTLETLPRLRYRYVAAMAATKAAHPERWSSYQAEKDVNGEWEWPGFVPYAIMEHYGKLQSSFRTLRTIEALNESGREVQAEQARANVIYHMGVLSHFVGDTAQPLHTTRHYNGWVGENPNGYTVSKQFHAYIDGGVVSLHQITYESLCARSKPERPVDAADPWPAILDHLRRSFVHFEDLYRMQKDGSLDGPPGKSLIEERLIDGGAMLGAMYRAAWESSVPEDAELKRFGQWTPAAAAPEPAAGQPAGAAPAQPAGRNGVPFGP